MKTKENKIFTFLLLFLIGFSIFNLYFMRDSTGTTHLDLEPGTYNLKQAGFWNDFIFIHITGLNWTIANEFDWCSGSGTWSNPYVIENMIINATDSSIGCGILIENSVNAYFNIKNVTIFGTSNGIKLENTNNGAIISSNLSENIASGINMINCVNNTISRNLFINNGAQGINLTSNCISNNLLGNTLKNDGTNFQDNGIYLGDYCDNNVIMENIICDNNINGILLEDYCQGNLIYNNTIKNTVTSQQDYGISLDYNCDQNNISLNIIEDISSYGIRLVTSDDNYILNNQLIDCSNGFYMLIALQSKIIRNTISGGSMGIFMSACDGSEIIGNFINDTGSYAIRLFINCDDNEFYDNIIKDNTNLGIQLNDPSDINNKFYKNAFISNGIHAIDNGMTTFWNNSIIGNFWDNYTGLDLNNDNIGDIPFNIYGAANANDSLPIFDHGAPFITINTPTPRQYGVNAPEFNIFANEPYIYSMWYTINNSKIKYYFTENGTINQDAWNALNDGNITISFYVRDLAWNLGSNSVNLMKDTSQIPGDGPPSLDPILIIVITLIIISVIIIAGIVVRQLPNRGKMKRSRKLNEEQLSEAQYFKDITNILIILAIHNESGLCLSKIALQGGIGMDENLFTGFISAIGSFKNELAKQMGLSVRGEGGDNIIEYKEFTITLMDGEYLRLGLVSYSSLGDLLKEQCGKVLRAYEIKHISELKNFDGDLQVFNDFEETIESGLDMNLNKKSIINVKQLSKYDAPKSFMTVLNDLRSRSEGFYPSEITLTLKREMNISDQEANFMVYVAYKNQLFLPIKHLSS